MANYFDTGILLTAGFSLSSQAPLDGRSVVELLTDLDAHIEENRAYEGMCVYVKENKKIYIFNGSTWEEFVGGGSSEKQIKDWVSGSSFLEGDYIYHEGEIYRCLTSNSDVDFDEANWEQLTYGIDELSKEDVERLLGLTKEEIEAMADLILDTEVRIDKTYSSSKIYQDIQQCLNDSKAFTLLELGKFSGASYKVVASTSEMTSESIIYLLASGNTYDMYIVEEDGATTKIGNMDVNLDDYYTKAEIEADYLKKADADGKYATIASVVGKVDKTDIITAKDNSATDDQVYSAKVMNTELDGIVKKTDISTTIDSSSTDDTVPTTKAVYDKVNSVAVTQLLTSSDSGTIEDYLEQLTPNVDIVFTSNNTTGELVTLTKEHLFMIEYRKAGNALYLQRAYQAKDGKLIACRSKNWWNSTWSKWQKVCTTTVADKSVTYINTFEDETYIKSMGNNKCAYHVINGYCVIRLETVCLATTDSFIQILSGLPKPGMVLYENAIERQMGSNSGARALFQLTHDGNLKVACNYGDTNVTGVRSMYVTFSYPVAE